MKKCIVSLSLLLVVSSFTPVFAEEDTSLDSPKYLSSYNIINNNGENIEPTSAPIFFYDIMNIIYRYEPIVKEYIIKKLNTPYVPIKEKIRIIKETWWEFKNFIKQKTGDDIEIDAISGAYR